MTITYKRITLGAVCLALLAGICGDGTGTAARAAGGQQRPEEVHRMDLRPAFDQYRLTIKLQGRRDTCHVFTIVAALEFAVACKYDYGVGLSEEYLNWAANEVSGEIRDGANFVELAQALAKWGVSEEQYMPYSPIFNPLYAPSQNAFDSAQKLHKLNFRWHWIKAPTPGTGNQLTDAHIAGIRSVLRRGWPVCAGRDHNIVIVGYQDDPQRDGGGTFTVRNSNIASYRTMTYAEVKAKSNAALWIDLPLK